MCKISHDYIEPPFKSKVVIFDEYPSIRDIKRATPRGCHFDELMVGDGAWIAVYIKEDKQ